VTLRPTRAYLLILTSAPVLFSCAYLRGVGGPREFADSVTERQDNDLAVAEQRFEGALRVPLTQQWQSSLDDPGVWVLARYEQGTPLFDGDRILLGNSRAPSLVVLDRLTGVQLDVITTVNPVQCAPVLVDGGYVVADTGGYLYRFTSDGSLLWRYHVDGPIYAPPTIDGDRVYVVTTTDVVVSVALDTGTWAWTFRPEETEVRDELSLLGSSSAVIRDGKLYTGLSDGRLICLAADRGTLAWELEVGEGRFVDVDTTPVFTDDGLLLVGGHSGPVVAVDVQRRAAVWRAETGAMGQVYLAYGRVFLSGDDGVLRCLDASTGDELWAWELRGGKAILNPPVGTGRILLVSTKAGELYAIDAFSGGAMWRLEPGKSHLGAAIPPAIEGRQVITVTNDGVVRSFLAPPGSVDTLDEEPAHRQTRYLAG
jgi:outer membrane protein assembly factor BamB